MHDLLNIRTLSFSSGIISLTICFCMIYISKTRKTYPGFTKWTITSILYTIALGLFSTRHIIPDFFSIIIGNLLIVTGNGFMAYGLELFTNTTKKIWLHFSLVLSTAILFFYFTYFQPNINIRIIIVSLIIAIHYFYCAYLAKKYIPQLIKTQNNLLVFTFGVLASWLILRIIQSAFIDGQIVDYMHPPIFHSLTVIVFFSGNIFIAIGLIVLNFQRVEFDLSATKQEVKTLRGLIPICSNCKKIRDDKGVWNQLEIYIRDHSDAKFSHGVCPECMSLLYPQIKTKHKTKELNHEKIT